MIRPRNAFGVCILHSLVSGLTTGLTGMICIHQTNPSPEFKLTLASFALPGLGLAIGTITALLLTPLSGSLCNDFRKS